MERRFFEPAADYNSPGITVSELLRIAAGGVGFLMTLIFASSSS